MEPPPPKRSFPVGTRAEPRAVCCHVCFFCGKTFAVATEYQRHIYGHHIVGGYEAGSSLPSVERRHIYGHQMASLAFQLHAAEQPSSSGGATKEEVKEEKESGEEKRKKKDTKKRKGKEKKGKKDETEEMPKMDKMESSFNTSLHSLPSPPPARPPPITAQPARFAVPAQPPDRYATSELQQPQPQQVQSMATAAAAAPAATKQGSSEGTNVLAAASGAPCCKFCSSRYSNATELVTHYISEHAATIADVQLLHHFGEKTVCQNPGLKYKFPAECHECNLKTPTLTKSFEHTIANHKGDLLKGTDASAITYVIILIAQFDVPLTLSVRIRLRRAVTACPNA